MHHAKYLKAMGSRIGDSVTVNIRPHFES